MKRIEKIRIIIAISLLGLIFAIYKSGITNYLHFETFKEHREQLLIYVHEHYWHAVFYYFLVYILIVLSSLPLVGTFTVVGGFLFKTLPATFYSVIAATIGSILSFLIVRRLVGRYIQKKYSYKLEEFNRNIEKYGTNYILILNLVGIIPIFVVNILAALTKINLFKFVYATGVGIIPATFVYAYAGKELASINSLKQILSFKILIIFVLFALMALLSLFVKRHFRNRK